MKNIKILPESIHNSWLEFLDQHRLKQLAEISKSIGENYTPAEEKVLRFMTTDLEKFKVIILGQDPYPEEGRATGRSFEVGDLGSWGGSFRQVSLKNIVRLIYKSYNNLEDYNSIQPYSVIKAMISKGEFNILPPNKLFESWEKQGVLLLNVYLTCEIGRPNSHRQIWEELTTELLTYISTKRPNLKWFLWGNEAISKKQHIRNGVIFSSRHPMLCSSKYQDDFLKSTCFTDTMNIINWLG